MAEEAHPTKTQESMTGEEKGQRGFTVSRYAPSSHVARRLCYALAVLLILAGAAALALYLVYRPSKPRFSVAGAAVYELRNATAAPANVLSTSMQLTVVARNPSERSSILYDRLSAYVVYRNQAVTPPADLPPLLQERGSTVAVSPLLGGPFVPVSPEVASGLRTDMSYGLVSLRLVLLGRIRYKSGPFRSGWYGMYVRCDMLLGLRKGAVGEVPLLGEPECNVDV